MNAKEQLRDMLDFIDEKEATRILVFAKEAFIPQTKTWDDIEEDEPTPDEIAAFKEYRAAKTGV